MNPPRFAGKWRSAGFVPRDEPSPVLKPAFVRPRGEDQRHSVSTGEAPAPAAAPKAYTGSAVLGVAPMHKSNLVPVFSPDEAVELARMRR